MRPTTGAIMRLKSIEIYGFKSFADKVKLDLADGITGVVGPNGCGKSNVVDAVRWVLGEQSAKSLRGKVMSDIIFQGSADRKPMNLAEVTLNLTDCEHLGLGYRDIELKRRAHRGGSTEFYINKKPVRMKDVNHLFLDTGVGKNAFSIFEQGKIDQLIHYSPQERSQLFIEVAGIGKLLNEKKEIERQCIATRTNYTRIEDIYKEQSKGVKKLEKQAQEAQEYKQWNQLNEWLALYILYRQYHDLESQVIQCQEKSQLLNSELGESERIEKLLKKDLDTVKVDLDATQKDLSEQINELHKIDKERDAQIKDLDYLKQAQGKSLDLKAMYERQLKQIRVDRKESQKNRDLHTKSVKKQTCIVQKLQKDLEQNACESKKLESSLEEVKQQQKESQKKLFDHKSTLSTLEKQIQQDRLEEKTIQVQLDQDSASIDLLKIQIQELNEDLKVISKQSGEQNKIVDKQRKEHAKLKDQYIVDQKSLQELKNKEQSVNKSLQESKASFAALEKLNKEGVGLQKGAQRLLKEIEKKNSDLNYDIKLLSDWVDADVNSLHLPFLKSYQSTVVVNGYEEVKKLLSWTQSQKIDDVSIVCLEPMGLDIHSLKPKELFEMLFKKVVTEADYEKSWKKWQKSAQEYISEDGYLIDSKGVLFSSGGAQGSVFQRQIDLKNIQEKIRSDEQVLSKVHGLIQKQQIELDQQHAQMISVDQSIRQLEMKVLELSMKEQASQSQLTKQIASQEEKNECLKKRKESLKLIEEQVKDKQKQLEKLLKEIESVEKVHFDLQVQLDKRYEDFKKHLSTCQASESLLFEQRGILRQNQSDLDLALQNLQNLDTKEVSIAKQSKLVEESQADAKEQKAKLDELICLLSQKQKDKNALKQEYEKKLSDLKSEAKKLEDKYQSLTIEHAKKQDKASSMNAHLESMEESKMNIIQSLDLQHQITLEHLDEHIEETLLEMKKKLHDRLSFSQKIEEIELQQFQPLVQRIREQINKLGEVNLASIKDYTESKNALEDIQENMSDIKDSLLSLEESCQKIESESRSIFQDTFNQVREAFIENVSILFNGGEANLTCEQADSFADMGVEIFVEPPGKKMKSIQLLSGGEKCMTAIALLFAFFRVKPSPFCILDEMDAPLDDSNIERFMKMLKQFLGQCQFIIVTHNKRTMAESDAIFGVSMMQKGISKLLSMRFDKSEQQVGVN